MDSSSTLVLKMFNAVYPTASSSLLDLNEIQTIATKVGYAVSKETSFDFVAHYLSNKNVDINSTFYKSWSDIVSKNRFELFLDQVSHYSSTYGANFKGDTFTKNDGDHSELAINFLEYKVLTLISKEDLVSRIETMLYANVAYSQEVVDDLFFLVKDLSIKVDTSLIKNKEMLCKICTDMNIVPSNNDDMVRYLVYLYTGKTLVIKSKKSIAEIKGIKKDISSLIEKYGVEKLSESFNRYKDLLLAMKGGNEAIINKVSKLSKNSHVPMVMPFWNVALGDSVDFKSFSSKIGELTAFKIIQLIGSIDKDLLNLKTKAYNIRNGKVFVDTKFKFKKSTGLLGLKRQVLYLRLVEILKDKFKNSSHTFSMPPGLNVVCPTSEKNFIGNYPIGTSFEFANKDNVIGIFWKGEDGGRDFDLSIEGSDGSRLGWNSSYAKENDIIFSGDMTSANPSATELFYFRGSVDLTDYLIKVNAYSCQEGSKYKLLIAQEASTKLDFNKNYMVNPSNVKFEVDLISEEKQSSVGFISEGKYYLMNLSSGSSRVSTNGEVTAKHIEYLAATKKCFLDLRKLLLDAGFVESDNSDLNFDFREVSKDTILKLFI